MKEKSSESRLEEALKYSELGWSVFPIKEGTKDQPLIKWKQYQTERPAKEQIISWWTQRPQANIGVVTGAISNLVVVDIEKGGSAEGFFPTITSKTGGGGRHLLYKHPGHEVKNRTRITELTDIRGDGGYIVAPPSISEKGKYDWILSPWEIEIEEYPANFINRITDRTPQTEVTEQPDAPVPVGQRNDAAARYAGKVLNKLPAELWDVAGWGALKEWNTKLTEEPLDEEEVRAVFESIKSREAQVTHGPDAEEIVFKPFTLTELYQEEFPEVMWLAEDLIPLGGITAITGDSNTYKSFLTNSLASCVSLGEKFLGNFTTHKGKVLVIDEENHRRFIRKRFEDMSIDPSDDVMFFSQLGIKLDKENSTKALKDFLDRERPALVIFDSLVRFHSKEENSATEMSKVMNEMRKLTADDRAVVIIHHHKKDQGFQKKGGSQSVRGSSDIFASLDCHISVERKDEHLILSQNKLRMQLQLDPFKVMLELTPNGGISFSYGGTDTTQQDRILEVGEEIKALLATATEELPLKVMCDEIDASKSIISKALKTLLAAEEISAERRAHGAYHYQLVTTDGETSQEKPEEELN
jgi:hypothetical protein